MDANRDLFYDDVKITSCYDSFPCIWNGGRIKFGDFSDDEVRNTVLLYNSRGISLRYTFTNCLLEEKHLDDKNGNTILDITRKYQLIPNGVNINSPLLMKYI